VLAIDWANLSYLGAFFGGFLTGIIVTSRLTKIIAEFLRNERNQHDR
jgi:hypothetical protein